ncbi:phosphoribosylglycinamide formyltransferase [Citrobacter freundii]|jgi:phosphoribosylglycinamide formyltransferase-1|uniref:Phosphoribosylglycinamide formyltransferase n=2 Tax=Citrobacter freundii complex TaxID=1344959 RepID=A0A7D6V746_CITFR|nr:MULTISPECIES: phosphoribosylglycinamide formyltransferase [Citrobacter]MBP8253840.1 phosphoribosylglycinamide formyltransferase [Citrobacter sp.]STE15858.1 phosphoribosylglycinamide formyltransferase [Escherichia coli]ATF48605.1 phosphoribosylglycinamide formyltransferase [Citrobacter werkmanii]EJB8470056.1 phosphoribosylglycinamide formyltransferase [Citrobacter freundii]EJB8557737.1 phosphoribosylglycinamide formyltransferase [Citrobacter freundii]
MKNIVVLISGNGSNLQAIIDACKQKKIKGTLRAVFSNKADAFGLERAREAGIPAHSLEASQFASREAFDRQLIQEIDAYAPDVVVLAGYMRILSPAFVAHYAERLLNIHPSLLPKYPGLHTHRQVLENGDEEHGTSVHFVTDELDGGPVILQAKVPVFDGDSEDDVTARVQAQEHAIYPLVVGWFVDGRLQMRDNAAWLDGIRLPPQGYAADEA